jgi:chemotaxis protein MotA
MTRLLGYLLGIVSIYASLKLLGQSVALYYDEIAMVMVVGGTLCVTLITFSPREIVGMAKLLVARTKTNWALDIISQFVTLSKLAQSAPGRIAVALEDQRVDPFIKEGVELILAGFTHEEVETVLSERMYTKRIQQEASSGVLKSLSKYPPAFGLMGTVLGLVSVMRGMSEGSTPEETGLRMSVALVATLYGLIMANFILLPTSEALLTKVKTSVAMDRLIIEGILLLKERASPLLVQEVLNSYVMGEDRRDHVGIRQTSMGPGSENRSQRGVA